MASKALIAGIVTTSPALRRNSEGAYLTFDVMSRDSRARCAVHAIIAAGDETALTEACSRVGSGSRIKLVGELTGPRGRNYLRVMLPAGIVALKERKGNET